MSLPKSLVDREYDKFEDKGDGLVRVRTSVEGSISLTGLNISGRFTSVELTNTEWRPLPVTPLANRNNMTVINEGNVIVRLNFNTSAPFEGRPVFPNGGKETFDIRGTIPVYGRTESGTFFVGVEELA